MIKAHLLNFIAHVRKRWMWPAVVGMMLAQVIYLRTLLKPSLGTRFLENLYDHLAGVSPLSPVSMRMAARSDLMVSLMVAIMLLIGLMLLHAKKEWDAAIGLPDMIRSADPAYDIRNTFGFLGVAAAVLSGMGLLFAMLLAGTVDSGAPAVLSPVWGVTGIFSLVAVVVSLLILVDKVCQSPVSALLVYVSYIPAGAVLHVLSDSGLNLHGFQHVVYSFRMLAQTVNYLRRGVIPGMGHRNPGLVLVVSATLLFTAHAYRYWRIRSGKWHEQKGTASGPEPGTGR